MDISTVYALILAKGTSVGARAFVVAFMSHIYYGKDK